jgi:polysaccharide pyruvyl transferase WcaK-like protein
VGLNDSTRAADSIPPEPGRPGARSVCIYGVYGKGNLGDEALLAAIADDVRSIRPGTRVTAFCSAPEHVSRVHGIAAFSRKPFRDFPAKIRAIIGADLFVIGGGTLLRDSARRRDDIRVVGSLIFWPLAAKLARVPVVALGSGVGSAQRALMRIAIKQFFSRADAVAFRDAASASRFARLVRTPAQTTCDPVVASPLFEPHNVARNASAETLAARGAAAPYVVLALRRPEWRPLRDNCDYFRICASAVAALQKETGATILLFPVQLSADFPDDRKPAEMLAHLLEREGVPTNRIVLQHWQSLEDGAAILQGAELVVSDRLHALLIAAKAGVAGVGTSTVDKITGCLAMIGTSAALRAVNAKTEGARALHAALLEAWRARKTERAAIFAGVRRWGNPGPNKALLRRYLEPMRHDDGRELSIPSGQG